MNKNAFYNTIKKYETTTDLNGEHINIHYLAVYENEEMLIHSFNDYKGTCDIRSISKTVISMITGIVKEKSKLGEFKYFDEETFIYPIIKDIINIRNKKTEDAFKTVQVKHLLTHTIGYSKVLLMRDDIKDMDQDLYLDYIVNTEIDYAPGEYYLYSNAGFYLLGIVLETVIGEDLLSFIEKNFFSLMDFEDYHWERYGNYIAAATRLWLRPEDLIKIGVLLLDDGVFNDVHIVPSEWIRYMKTETVLTPDVDTPQSTFRRYAYAKGMWLAKDKEINFGHGTDGQMVVVLPEKNIVVAVMSYQHDLTQLESILNDLIETI